MGILILLYLLGGVGLIISGIIAVSAAPRISKSKLKYALLYIASEWMLCYGYYLVVQMLSYIIPGLYHVPLAVTLAILFVPMVASMVINAIIFRRAWRNNTHDQAFFTKVRPMQNPTIRKLGLVGIAAFAVTVWMPISVALMHSVSSISEESLGLGPFSNLALSIMTMLVSPITAALVVVAVIICIWKKRKKD